MPDFIIQPSPKVIISDASNSELPLHTFELLILVEPDPETWMVRPGGSDNWSEIVNSYNEAIADEFPDYAIPFMALLHYQDAYNIFDYLVDIGFVNVIFHLFDYNDLSSFEYYLRGIIAEHPTWKVGVIGAMLEEDVIRIANFVSETGLPTTVLNRYCLTRESFINLDALDDYRSWLHSAGSEEE
ncbi:MAG: hypothetical protein ISR58_20750 [Anaerolineales bacterium]|nr:hypothetical protein [Chloroflexota bacterium]MBL6983619.1 hypothetical protein [Anaerolineales bacterium]